MIVHFVPFSIEVALKVVRGEKLGERMPELFFSYKAM
jgi:hypothetical protein